ncbi:unnamed protein product [marine sediment metagenome]|uniref:Chaperone DnaJ C-terminal domain-containing protein n=1 Tax=marine sediment metagenome TaxID=412755 RepID=X0UV11_9ZZZZ
MTICPECQGEGQKPEKPCNVCKGEGRVWGKEAMEIFIPAGVDSNQILRIKNKGNAGRKSGKSGHIFVRILVKRHPVFERRGDDLYTQREISFSQAVLGDNIDVHTLHAKGLSLKVPAGTRSGKIFRISGHGISNFSGLKKGNLYVEIQVSIPKRLNRKQKDLLKQLKQQGL